MLGTKEEGRLSHKDRAELDPQRQAPEGTQPPLRLAPLNKRVGMTVLG